MNGCSQSHLAVAIEPQPGVTSSVPLKAIFGDKVGHILPSWSLHHGIDGPVVVRGTVSRAFVLCCPYIEIYRSDHSVLATFLLPLCQVPLAVRRALAVKVRLLRLYLFRDEGRKLSLTVSSGRRSCHSYFTYFEVIETFRYNIGPNFAFVDDITCALCMTAHGPGAVALVEATVDLLSREWQAPQRFSKRLSRLKHGDDDLLVDVSSLIGMIVKMIEG